MGYNTTIFILNDGLHEIRANPKEFASKVVDAISAGYEREIALGCFSNIITVMATAHADSPRLYYSHGNRMVDLSRDPKLDEQDPEFLVKVLEEDIKESQRLLTRYKRHLQEKVQARKGKSL